MNHAVTDNNAQSRPLDFDATTHLELTTNGVEFSIWLFDYLIGTGETIEEALDDAKSFIRGATEE